MRYIGRSGWNTLAFGGIPDDELLEAVDESYRLVVGGCRGSDRPEGWDERGTGRRGPVDAATSLTGPNRPVICDDVPWTNADPPTRCRR